VIIPRVEPAQLRARRAAAQLLDEARARSAPEIVGRLLAVQSQDLRAARLVLRARSARLTAADVDQELTTERSLVVAWLLRGTLHLVRQEDYPWLLALTAHTQATASRRRLGQEGVSPADAERAVVVIERALAAEGSLTRPELAERLAAQGIPTARQATPHLLKLAALRGVAVLGPLRDGTQAFALTRDWLGVQPAGFDPEAALAELARRYLAAHGPALPADLAAWAGLPLRDAQAGLGAVAAELVELDGGLLDLAARTPTPAFLPPRLLPAFDPYLLGWKDRTFAVPAEHARRVHPGGGILRATATIDGVAAGTWSLRGGRVTVEPFAPLLPEQAAALEAEAADVVRFEATVRTDVLDA
jgi:hypothetical protein